MSAPKEKNPDDDFLKTTDGSSEGILAVDAVPSISWHTS